MVILASHREFLVARGSYVLVQLRWTGSEAQVRVTPLSNDVYVDLTTEFNIRPIAARQEARAMILSSMNHVAGLNVANTGNH